MDYEGVGAVVIADTARRLSAFSMRGYHGPRTTTKERINDWSVRLNDQAFSRSLKQTAMRKISRLVHKFMEWAGEGRHPDQVLGQCSEDYWNVWQAQRCE